MRTFILTITIIFSGYATLSSQTNTFPASGTVGIGTAAPSNPEVKLQIEDGSAGIGHYSADSWLKIQQLSGDGYGYAIQHKNASVFTNEQGSVNQALVLGDVSADTNQVLLGVSLKDPVFSPDWIPKLTLTGSGNLGLGTTAPNAKIDVNLGVTSGRGLQLIGTNLDVDFYIGHDGVNYGYYWRYLGTGSGNENVLQLWSDNLKEEDKKVYEVKQDGNIFFQNKVAVGTATLPTGYTFAVNGQAMFTYIQVKQEGEWPDYVFSKDYELKDLDEIERFVNENSHLPGMPDGEEVQENGINLAGMNAKLLEKVEELTLYLIEQNKRLDAQDEEINELKKLMNRED